MRGTVRSDARQQDAAMPVPLPNGLEVIARTREVGIAADGCILIQLWHATATLDAFAHCEAAVERFAAAHKRFSTLNVVEPSVGTPSAEVREAAGRFVARFESKAVANALVIEGTALSKRASG